MAVGCLIFALAPVVTAHTVNLHLWAVVLSYGVMSSVGQNMAIVATLTVPMAWFPGHRGLVSGIVVSGFGAGSFVFNQIQTHLANPADLPLSNGYFLEEEVLERVPRLLVCTMCKRKLFSFLIAFLRCLSA